MTSTVQRTVGLVALVALVALLAGCEQRTETVLTGHTIRAHDVAKLALGQSTASDVERLFGAPDERGADGSLTYRATAVRRHARSVAGWIVRGASQTIGWRTATFRFEGGVLTRVCRERS
jgi:hypothetical protein